jgi:hypothetical protein
MIVDDDIARPGRLEHRRNGRIGAAAEQFDLVDEAVGVHRTDDEYFIAVVRFDMMSK